MIIILQVRHTGSRHRFCESAQHLIQAEPACTKAHNENLEQIPLRLRISGLNQSLLSDDWFSHETLSHNGICPRLSLCAFVHAALPESGPTTSSNNNIFIRMIQRLDDGCCPEYTRCSSNLRPGKPARKQEKETGKARARILQATNLPLKHHRSRHH